jgi:hypothetical protein
LVLPEKAQKNLPKIRRKWLKLEKRRQEEGVKVKKKRTRGPSTYRPEGRRKGKEERKERLSRE